MIQLILRADDVGYSEAVNYGILTSVKDGLITNVGVMPNMPSAVDGVNLLKGYPIDFGQHTNICIGKPCADPSLIPSLLNDTGDFKSSKDHRAAFKQGIDLIQLDEAVIEVEAQYFRFKEITGKEPDYFEAHAIASPNLWKALRIVANKYSLPLLDMNPSSSESSYCDKDIQMLPMESMQENYDPFLTLQRDIQTCAKEDKANVFVCHPGYIDGYLLRNSSLTINRVKEVEMLCSQETKDWLQNNSIQCIRFSDLRNK